MPQNTENTRSNRRIAKIVSFLSSLCPQPDYEIVASIQQQQTEINQSVNQQLSLILKRLDELEARTPAKKTSKKVNA